MTDLYWNQKLSAGEIADKYDLLMKNVNKMMIRRGIPRRTKSEAMKLMWERNRRNRLDRWGASGEYSFKRAPNHPRANKYGFVQEHILVLEEKMGESLPKDWCTHHLNGIKDDNRPENLMGMPKVKHNYLHNPYINENKKEELKREFNL